MKVNFKPNLFLEVAELERFRVSLDTEGFRKYILEEIESYGLVKNHKTDSTFLNGKVEQDTDNIDGDKTIKIRELQAIDKSGNFIYQPQITQIVVPSDSNWYWLKISHQYTNIEKGTFSIDSTGNLVGSSDSELLTILRGMPNFASRIKFVNSTENTLEYDVLEVIDDQNAVLQHPSLTIGGSSEFVAETDLKIKIVGTFTPGVVIPSGDKYPFSYDSCYLQLVQESVYNQKPTHTSGTHFFLARIRVYNNEVIIQDKRLEYFESKGAKRVLEIERTENPLIGVEAVKWNHTLTPADTNIVEIAWGMRSQNWSIDTTLRKVTLFGSASGGKFKSIDSFTDGDFDGWRIYTANGKYSRVLTSTKSGSAINLVLDILDVDNYSDDGGVTINSINGEYVLVVPDSDSIVIKCIPNIEDNQEFMTREFTFPINTLLAKLELVVFKIDTCLYNIQYQYKSYKEFTDFFVIPSDTDSGYYKEISFDVDNGTLKTIADRVKQTYTADNTDGFIELVLAPHSYYNFQNKVDKGDLIGVNTITSLGSTLYELKVGIAKNYQYLTGDISLTGDDVYFSLTTSNAIEGNEFRLHFNCDSIVLGGNTITIAYPGSGSTTVVLKTITEADVYMMKNIKGGIIFDCVYTGSRWVISQNYELGPPKQIITLDGVISDLFASSGLGKVQGLYGYALCDGNNDTPNLSGRFILGSKTGAYAVGDFGGEETHVLTIPEMPSHSHLYDKPNSKMVAKNAGSGESAGDPNASTSTATSNTGDGQAHNNMPPYYVLIYAKKLF